MASDPQESSVPSTEVVSEEQVAKLPVLLGAQHKVQLAVPDGKPVRYVELVFATYCRVPQGVLYSSFKIGEEEKAFKFDMSVIQDNEPFMFDLGDHFVGAAVEITLVPQYTDPTTSLALWYGNNVPSHRLLKEKEVAMGPMGMPLISIITATYKTPMAVLQETVQSVLSQSYSNWEWVIVDDGSQDEELSKYLSSLARKEKGIQVVLSKNNEGISEAQNKALEKVKGEWMVVLDHDDLLERTALMEIALCVDSNPGVDLIYTDEDKVGEDGVRSAPFFKPDWSPALFMCQNYINHLTAFRMDRVRSHAFGYETKYNGSQDYRFLIKYLWGEDQDTLLPIAKVVHIPRILYHWRTLPTSVASSLSAKPYALRVAREALTELLVLSTGDGDVFNTTNLSVYRPVLYLPSEPTVNIVIPAKDQFDVTANCLESLYKTQYDSACVSIVDNGSPAEKAKSFYEGCLNPEYDTTLKPLDYAISLGEYPFNFSKQSNAGAGMFNTDYVLFLNNDTEIMDHHWLREMVSWMEVYPDIGAVGARLLYPNGTLQHGGVDMGVGGVAGHTLRGTPYGSGGYFCRAMTVHEVSAVTGACMLVRKSVFDKVGGFNEDLPQAFNDVDLCLKIRKAGHRIIYNPWVMLYHHESISRGKDNHKDTSFASSIKYMHDTWMHEIQNDPFFNPNFSRNSEQYVPR